MPRVIWKGAISFGLVHVPVALYPASQEVGVDFDWLDKRTMDPVGYKRVNKRTGKEIAKEDIVKGVKLDDGDYVVLSDEEIKAAFPKSTQTIEIEAFVKASEIAFVLLERPYYLEPVGKGERVYALLRESMQDAGVIGIARVVMHNKEHLAALIPSGAALMLNTIRWAQREYMREELMLAGWKVSEASNGFEALQKCEASMPGLILLDLMMPVMDGFAFLEELRHRPGGGGVPVLVVTARDLSDEERRRLNRSLAQVLARESLTREQLLDRIKEQMPAVVRP